MAAFRTPGHFPQNAESDKALSLLLSSAMTVATHPMTTMKVLVQIGYEPLPATVTTTVFGSKVYRLPGLFQYLRHLKESQGFFGLYRGVIPRILSGLIGTVVNDSALEALQSNDNDSGNTIEKTFPEEAKDFTIETCKQTAAKCISIIVSHPFQVITVRMIVQHVGKETLYNGIFGSVKEIYNDQGILGFFAGVAPRIVGEVLSLWMYRACSFFVNKYILDGEMASRKEVHVYVTALSQWLSGMFTYPFVIVSNIMITNHVGLAAGEPPAMPVYADWVDCFKHLRQTGNLWRGSSLFRRTAKALPVTN